MPDAHLCRPMTNKHKDPLPCPFCGSDEYVQAVRNGWDLWSVSCATCEVNMEQAGGGWIKKQDAVDNWNTRNGKLVTER